MRKLQEISWIRIGAEGIAIVVSILLAFWIQAWWDDKQLRENERVILESLLTELSTTQNRLRFMGSFAGGIRDSSTQLLQAAIGPEVQLSDKEIDRLLGDTTWYVPLDHLDTPELDSLVSSDDLGLISNAQLKRMLSTWPHKVRAARVLIANDFHFFTDSYLPYLHMNTSFQQIINGAMHQPGNSGIVWPGTEMALKEVVSHRELLSDRYFQNLLSQRISWITEILDFGPRDRQIELDEIVTLIEMELERNFAD